jgi:hypothetical protein
MARGFAHAAPRPVTLEPQTPIHLDVSQPGET